jgi:beta-galactosidase
MVYLAHELTQVSPKDVLVMTNCEEVRLTWLGDVVGTQKPDENYKPMPHPPVIFKDVFDFSTIKSKWGKRLDEVEMIAEGLIGGKVVCVQKKKYPQRSTWLELQTDDQGIGLTADGGDFVAVHATVIDGRGTRKVLASESVLFLVDGAGELIGGAAQQMNPMKTQFGTATALIRASSKSGLIRVRAFSDGLYPAEELIIPTAAPAIPLLFDSVYAAASKSPSSKFSVQEFFVNPNNSTGTPSELQTLREENRRLKQETVAREQELMELRNKN